MAKMNGTTSAWGAFLDSTLDRLGDAAVFGGILLYFAGQPIWVAVTLVALIFGQLTSYVRARAESLGYAANGGLAARADRLLVILLGALAGRVRRAVRARTGDGVPGPGRRGHGRPADRARLPAGEGRRCLTSAACSGPARPDRLPRRLGRRRPVSRVRCARPIFAAALGGWCGGTGGRCADSGTTWRRDRSAGGRRPRPRRDQLVPADFPRGSRPAALRQRTHRRRGARPRRGPAARRVRPSRRGRGAAAQRQLGPGGCVGVRCRAAGDHGGRAAG